MRNLPTKAVLHLAAAVLYLSATGVGCTSQPTPLKRPNAASFVDEKILIITDRGNHRLVTLDIASNKVLAEFGKHGSEVQDLYAPWASKLDGNGNVYVTDRVFDDSGAIGIHDGVKVFSKSGQFVREYGQTDYKKEDEKRAKPYGVDLDSIGRVYTADTGTNGIRVFSKEGELLARHEFKTGSAFGEASCLQDAAADEVRKLIFVTDASNCRVYVFSMKEEGGKLVLKLEREFGTYGSGDGQLSYPQYLAVDHDSGEIYLTDMGNFRVQVFTTEGKFVRRFSPPEVKNWQALGIALSKEKRVAVTDGLNNAVWVFDKEGKLEHKVEVAQ